MKAKTSLSFVVLSFLALASLSGRAEWEGRFPCGIVPFKLSIVKPVQVPVPWYGYDSEPDRWGEFSVYGLDLGLESDTDTIYGLALTGLAWSRTEIAGLDVAIAAIRQDAYGWQLGGGAVAKGEAYGWQLGAYTYGCQGLYGLQTGVLNMAGAVRGVQVGVANSCHDLKGVQLGILNFNFGGPLVFFPIVNAGF